MLDYLENGLNFVSKLIANYKNYNMNSLKSKETTRLKPEILKKIEEKPVLKALLAEHFKVSTFTITRWIKNNDPYLCFIEAQGIISRELGVPIAEISELSTLTEEG